MRKTGRQSLQRGWRQKARGNIALLLAPEPLRRYGSARPILRNESLSSRSQIPAVPRAAKGVVCYYRRRKLYDVGIYLENLHASEGAHCNGQQSSRSFTPIWNSGRWILDIGQHSINTRSPQCDNTVVRSLCMCQCLTSRLWA